MPVHNYRNLPNLITLVRIGLIPVFIIVFLLPYNWTRIACAILFAVAAITDWFDGYLARRLDLVSPFGAFLDPVADKLMVASALVLLVLDDPTPWVAVPAIVIIGREIAISALREWMAEVGNRAAVKVSSYGKIKTVAQMAAVIFMLYKLPVWGLETYKIGLILLYIAASLTLWSMWCYLQNAWPTLQNSDK